MASWNYSSPAYNYIPPGNYRARISSASWATSKKSGRLMLVVKFNVSGHSSTVTKFIVCDNSSPENTNKTNFMISRFCEAFGLNPYDLAQDGFDFNQWIGREGGLEVGADKRDDGSEFPSVKKFLTRNQFEFLPAFKSAQANTQTQAQQNPQSHFQAQSTQGNINPYAVNPNAQAIPF